MEFILNPNRTLINGVQHFYQTTKPTVRPDGSALVARDKWYKTDDGTEWFWNGTYWLSAIRYKQTILTPSSLSSTSATNFGFQHIGWQVLYTRLDVMGRYESAPTNPATDYWEFHVSYVTAGSSTSIPGSPVLSTQGTSYSLLNNFYRGQNTNILLDFSNNPDNAGAGVSPRGLFSNWTKRGSPPNISSVSFYIEYQLISP